VLALFGPLRSAWAPPSQRSLGLLTVNALAAAKELIVPIQCEYYALEGLGQLLRNVALVQQNINTDLSLTGIVLTMFDSRTKLSEQVVDEVRKYFGKQVYDTIIPRTVRLSEAPGYGEPITVYDSKSKAAACYRALALSRLWKRCSKNRSCPILARREEIKPWLSVFLWASFVSSRADTLFVPRGTKTSQDDPRGQPKQRVAHPTSLIEQFTVWPPALPVPRGQPPGQRAPLPCRCR